MTNSAPSFATSRLVFWLWFSQMMIIGAMEISGPFWPLILQSLHTVPAAQLPFWSALMYLLPLITAMLTAPWWGAIGDRYGHKSMLLKATIALGVAQLAMALTQDVVVLALIRFAQGLFAGSIAAAQAYGLRMSLESNHQFVLGKLQSGVAAGSLLGPLAGGAVAQYINYNALFWIGGVVCFAIAFMLLVILPSDMGMAKAHKRTQPGRPMSSAVIFSVPIILGAIVFAQMAKRTPNTFFSLYAESALQASDFMIGILYASTGLSILVWAPLWGRLFDRKGDAAVARYLPLICLAAALTQIMQAMVESSLLACLLVRLLWGVWLAALLPLLLGQLKQSASPDLIGQIIGKGHRFSKLGGIVGIAIGAVSVSWLSLRWGFVFIAVIYLLMALLLWWGRYASQSPRRYGPA